MTTTLNAYLTAYDAAADADEDARETYGAEYDQTFAVAGEDARYVSESDLAGNPDEREVGHIYMAADGYFRYAGGPAEPQW